MHEPGFDDDYPDFSIEERFAKWEAMTPAEQQAIIDNNARMDEAFFNADDDSW